MEGRATKKIRDMQTIYMCNRGTTYLEDHLTRDFITNLMCSTHKQWLGQNLIKHHHMEGAIAIKTRGQLARELDRLPNKDIYTVAEKDRWMLDLNPSDKLVMGMQEMQYTVFEPKAAEAQDKLLSKRTSG